MQRRSKCEGKYSQARKVTFMSINAWLAIRKAAKEFLGAEGLPNLMCKGYIFDASQELVDAQENSRVYELMGLSDSTNFIKQLGINLCKNCKKREGNVYLLK